MIDSPEVAGDYYQKISERMAVSYIDSISTTLTKPILAQDTGLSVRKRVIKLLKSFYSVTTDNAIKIDICRGLVMRLHDEDDTVKDLAVKTLEELWFPPVPLQSAMKKSANQANQDKSGLLTKVSVIMGTAAYFNDRNHPLEEVLHKIMNGKEGNEAAGLHARYTEISETLIDGLVDASDLPGFVSVGIHIPIECLFSLLLRRSSTASGLSTSSVQHTLPFFLVRTLLRFSPT
jgi:cohesin loading factor subunit SCC2